jgi:hypothetical protein
MFDGSLVRADQITEITLSQTPEIAGKPPHWLLDVTTAVPVGGGDRDRWRTSPLHRTLAQVHAQPREAPAVLAELLAQLDDAGAAGILRADTVHMRHPPRSAQTVVAGEVRFGFTPFAEAKPPADIDGTDHP